MSHRTTMPPLKRTRSQETFLHSLHEHRTKKSGAQNAIVGSAFGQTRKDAAQVPVVSPPLPYRKALLGAYKASGCVGSSFVAAATTKPFNELVAERHNQFGQFNGLITNGAYVERLQQVMAAREPVWKHHGREWQLWSPCYHKDTKPDDAKKICAPCAQYWHHRAKLATIDPTGDDWRLTASWRK